MTKDRKRLLTMARGGKAETDPLENPLDFIVEDHMREREVCALIDNLVAARPIKRAERQMIFSFLTEDLPQHLADEEIDLFPLMLERCDPEEEIKSVIDKLESDHAHAFADAPAIAALIQEVVSGDAPLSEAVCAQLAEFASHARRHLILENAIILPIARARLTKDDLKTMREHMLERRGLDHRQEAETC
jgi:hemerythrin-like domain-containing protein